MKSPMKFLIIALLSISVISVVISCVSEPGSATATKTTTEAETTEITTLNGIHKVDLEASKIYWKGYKIFGNHTGTIDLTEGQMGFESNNIISGNFVVDMNSVKVTELMDDGDDEEEEEEESPEDDKNDLAHHLMDGDFFDAKTYPSASFQITNATKNGNSYRITGDMTIKGVTKTISFDSELVGKTFNATIPIDRTEFGIKYGSGTFFSNLGDNAIKDKFDLVVSLVLK